MTITDGSSKEALLIGCLALFCVFLGMKVDDLAETLWGTDEVTPELAPIPLPHEQITNPAFFPLRIFDAQPPAAPVQPLQRLADGKTSDDAIIAGVLAYYRNQENMLREKWQEPDPDRLKAMLAMYVIHISHPYGASPSPGSFADYVWKTPVSSCGTYAKFQSRLLDAFGLKWRYVAVSSGTHGWIEAEIKGRWEIFDSTANVWVDQSAFDLLDGRPRRYRLFYSPWSDPARPDARGWVAGQAEPHLYSPGVLRTSMPGLGIYFMTNEYRQLRGLRVEVWKNFMPPVPRKSLQVSLAPGPSEGSGGGR